VAFRFFRRKKLFPGVSLNLSKSGGSLSFGPRGAKVTIGPRGIRKTVGVPGTGMYWTDLTPYGQAEDSRHREPSQTDIRPGAPLSLGFFRRLITPQSDEDFVDGMEQFVLGNESAALRFFGKASHLADSAFMAGIVSLRKNRYDDAERFLGIAKSKQARLGHYFTKYDVQATVSLPITPQLTAIIGPNPRGILLALAEVYQGKRAPKAAIRSLRQLHRREPDDLVVILSLVEMLVEDAKSKSSCQAVVNITKEITNESGIHAAVLLYKAIALRHLGLLVASRNTLTAALRRKRNRSDEFLRAVRYERAAVYEMLGQKRRARGDLESLYADAPDYEDVAGRLGL
jgi:tetratricopeptide (TPR) repeat protein